MEDENKPKRKGVENCDSNKVFVLSVNRSEKNRNRMKKQIR